MTRMILALAALASLSCSNATEPTRMACEVDNTGVVRFRNDNPNTSFVTYDVIWDGIQIVQGLGPTLTSPARTEAAGVAHTLLFRPSVGSGGTGCSQSTPILIRCQEITLTCRSLI